MEYLPNRRAWRRPAAWLASAVLLAALALPAAHALLQPFAFNQFYILRLEARHGVLSPASAAAGLRSAYASGTNALLRRPARQVPAWTDTLGMFRHVFEWLPGYAVVYPTEGFYYFRAEMGGRSVAGNLRLADLDRGRITFAYFDRKTLETLWTTVDSADGLRVRRRSPWRYEVEFGGRTVTFRLSDAGSRPPRRLALLPEEELVGQVHDESGMRFFLLFNRATDSFYYVLNDERGTVDRFADAGRSFVVGRRTGFLFYHDRRHERKVLVGVDVENVLLNTYLDGPPDQVPFRARLRERVYRAYPGMRAGPDIDETGVMVSDTGWARVAVAPLNVYGAVPDMVAYLLPSEPERLPPSVLWTYLTKETWNSPEWLAEVDDQLHREGKPPLAKPAWYVLMQRGEYPDRRRLRPTAAGLRPAGAPAPGPAEAPRPAGG